jgi:hypothetical protein
MALLPSVCWLLFIVVDIIRVPDQKDWDDGGSSNNNCSVSVLKPPKWAEQYPRLGVALEMKKADWKPFHNALDKSDSKKILMTFPRSVLLPWLASSQNLA